MVYFYKITIKIWIRRSITNWTCNWLNLCMSHFHKQLWQGGFQCHRQKPQKVSHWSLLEQLIINSIFFFCWTHKYIHFVTRNMMKLVWQVLLIKKPDLLCDINLLFIASSKIAHLYLEKKIFIVIISMFFCTSDLLFLDHFGKSG